MQLAMKTSSQANNIPFLSAQVKTELPNSFGSLQSGKTDSSFLNMVHSYEHDIKNENHVQNKETLKAETPSENTSPALKEKQPDKMEKTKSPEEESKSKEKTNVKDEKKKTSKKDVSEKENLALVNQKTIVKDENNGDSKLSLKKTSGAKSVDKAGKSKSSENDLAENQLSFLKTREDSEDIDSIIANVQDYKAEKSEKDLLQDAQNLSLENPKSFLDEAENATENRTASLVTKTVLSKAAGSEEKTVSGKTESKKASSKKESLFTIIDERGTASKEEAAKSQKSKLTVSKSSESNNELNLTMTLNKNAEQNILSSNNQTAGASGSNFQAMLSEQIQQNAPDFVKAGNIVLQDSKSGTINMVLKPESLGNVKISLQLSDKVITGQITVQSQEAYDAFKQNIETLKQAFQQSGFESPQFNLSFSNNGGSGNPQQGQQQMANSWLGNQTYGDYASSSSTVSQGDFVSAKKESNYVIDVVA